MPEVDLAGEAAKASLVDSLAIRQRAVEECLELVCVAPFLDKQRLVVVGDHLVVEASTLASRVGDIAPEVGVARLRGADLAVGLVRCRVDDAAASCYRVMLLVGVGCVVG